MNLVLVGNEQLSDILCSCFCNAMELLVLTFQRRIEVMRGKGGILLIGMQIVSGNSGILWMLVRMWIFVFRSISHIVIPSYSFNPPVSKATQYMESCECSSKYLNSIHSVSHIIRLIDLILLATHQIRTESRCGKYSLFIGDSWSEWL